MMNETEFVTEFGATLRAVIQKALIEEAARVEQRTAMSELSAAPSSGYLTKKLGEKDRALAEANKDLDRAIALHAHHVYTLFPLPRT